MTLSEQALARFAQRQAAQGKYVVCEYRGAQVFAVYAYDDKPRAEHKRTVIDLKTDGSYARILEPTK